MSYLNFESRMDRRTVPLVSFFLSVFYLFSPLPCWPQAAPAGPAAISSSHRDPLSVRPVDRVTAQVDDTRLVVLSNSRHPWAIPEYSAGEVPQDQRLERVLLVLRPDAIQEQALEELIRAQQNPASPYYHRWLTPASFGKRFGVSAYDLAQLSNWLRQHGMQVDEIPPSHRGILFSGSAAQVEAAFHASIHRYVVNGESHYANATDPEIPQAFAGVVHGVVSLHDFRSAPQLVSAPRYTAGNGAHFLAPLDWDAIYNVNPLLNQGFDGTGQSIAVLGRVDVAMQDVRAFRANSALPPNDPVMIVNGPDPGYPDCNDEAESALDVEWAGAIASNATIRFVTSKSTTTDGIALSAQYAVNHNVAPIISLSYGLCEAAYSSAGNAFWNSLWAQAASQGMSVFVSSGDNGAAGCDSPSLATASHGRGINALCSSPYSTCVGGTQFDDVYNSGQYWSDTNGSGMSSALSYIPEVAWNESGWSGGLWSTGGGASLLYSKPSWQNVPGVPADGMRDVPDVSMTAAIHDAYIIQIQGGPFLVAGTSAATPSFASVMAMLLQETGSAQGNANPNLYSLANAQYSAGGPTVFHDITSGNNSVPGVVGFSTGIGYDLATGLGSVDANLFVNNWSAPVPSSFSLSSSAPSVTSSVAAPATITLTSAVTGGFNSPVTLFVSGLPSKVTAAFSPSSLSGNASSTLTLTEASGATAGNYNLTIKATGRGLTRTVSLTLTVVTPNFTLAANIGSANVLVGSPATVTLTASALNGFNSPVAFTISGLPGKVTAAFSPSSLSAPGNGSSTLTLTEASGATAGNYHLTIKATGGGLTKTVSLTLTVVTPSFSVTFSGTAVSLKQGGTILVTITTAGGNGFNSPINLSFSGLPKGVTASFSRTSISAPGNGSSVLTFKAATGNSAPIGNYSVTVSASGGGITQTQRLSLAVTR